MVGLVGCIFVLALLWLVSRVVYPTAAQRAAIEELESWPDYAGENASPLLWTLGRDVPDEALDVVIAEDVRTWEGLDPSQIYGPDGSGPPTAADAYADLTPSEADRNAFCPQLKGDCLARVRADLPAYQALVERNAAYFDRIDRLQDFGFVKSAFPYGAGSGLFGVPVNALATRNAVQFLTGDGDVSIAAVGEVCRDLLTWRRLGARSDDLIMRITGIVIAGRENGWLLAEMLAELPIQADLPAPCAEALAPPEPIDLSMCNAMRREFGFTKAMTEAAAAQFSDGERGTFDRLASVLLIDPATSLGMRAEALTTSCSLGAASASERDASFAALAEGLSSLWRFECVANVLGCVLEGVASPAAYSDYAERMADYGARLRALGTLAWLREQAAAGQTGDMASEPASGGGLAAALLPSRPVALNDPEDALRVSPDGTALLITKRWNRRGEHWSIPLPPALRGN